MIELYRAPKRRSGCNACGKEELLVLASILNGSLCSRCYSKMITPNGLVTPSGDIVTKELEMKLLNYKEPYSNLLIAVFKDIYHRYVARIDRIVSTGDIVKVKMECIYRGKKCTLDISSGQMGVHKQLRYKIYDAKTKSTKVIRTFIEHNVDGKIYIVK